MARHKRLNGEEESEGSVLDISSLIDVCFLLLIYFIVATSIVQEKKLDMTMPGTSSGGKPPELDPAYIKVDGTGVVYWGEGGSQIAIESNPDQRYLASLYERLADLNQTAKQMGTKPMVRLEVVGGAKNQRVVDVMNVLTEAGIKGVGLVESRD